MEKLPAVMACVPAGMPELETMLADTGLDPDRMRLVLHQFYSSRISQSANPKNRESQLYKDGWVPMYGRILYSAGGGNSHQKYLMFLEDNNLIVPKRNKAGNKSCVVGKYACLYKINPDLLNVPGYNRHFRQEQITSQKVLRSLEIIRKRYGSKTLSKNVEPIHQQLIEMTRESMFDIASADEYVFEKKPKNQPIKEYMDMMQGFNDGLLYHGTVDSFGERLYTPISGTWKPLRQFLRFRDKPNLELHELDIANSQPFFSSICVNPKAIKELLPEFEPIADALAKLCLYDDYKMYSHLCQQGLIYEYWASVLKIPKKEAKIDFLASVMYSRPGSMKMEVRRAKMYFEVHFPTVAEMFKFVKSRPETTLPFIKDVYVHNGKFQGRTSYFKNLPLMMQRLESRLIIKRICPILIEKGIRFLTVHDSFIAEPDSIPIIKEVIDAEFVKIGVRPPTTSVRKAGK
jgi:hypothetical protein